MQSPSAVQILSSKALEELFGLKTPDDNHSPGIVYDFRVGFIFWSVTLYNINCQQYSISFNLLGLHINRSMSSMLFCRYQVQREREVELFVITLSLVDCVSLLPLLHQSEHLSTHWSQVLLEELIKLQSRSSVWETDSVFTCFIYFFSLRYGNILFPSLNALLSGGG